jgi:hypothetical protein
VQVVDNAAFVDGTTTLEMAGFIFDEVAGTALTENDAAAARVDSKRAQVLVLEDATTRGRRATVTSGGAVSVTVSGPTTTTGTPAGVTVSTSAVSLKASNANRLAIRIVNAGVGVLYIGSSNAVTSSGANLGVAIPPFGVYEDSGPGIYTGDLFGIYDQTASAQNVSVWELTA